MAYNKQFKTFTELADGIIKIQEEAFFDIADDNYAFTLNNSSNFECASVLYCSSKVRNGCTSYSGKKYLCNSISKTEFYKKYKHLITDDLIFQNV